MHYVFR